jgi:hypothetical protein
MTDMKKTAAAIIVAAFAFAADALTVEEARANLKAARTAYTNALAEAGITNTPRRAKSGKRSAATAGARTTTALSKSQAAFFENRRIAVSRDTTTIPGAVITTWYRNGKPDTKAPAVVTNYLHTIVGAEQKNPLQALAEQLREAAEQWQAAATNAQARVERVTAALDEKRDEYVQKRDAAALPTTKAIYQAFIDAIDRIKENLNARGNE